VYLETYRSRYRAGRETLAGARDAFRAAGFEVSGCVTTTQVGKLSTGWNLISCYTDRRTQDELKSIFEYTAGLFDEIMIDDFWFTDCACEECDRARRARKVTAGEETFDVQGDAWEDYRLELMVRLSRSHVLGAARKVNPAVKMIIKYPEWYDRYHERGYDVGRQTRDFDRIWVGTETRDRSRPNPRVQYGAYFLMRWLGALGGAKTGGGWFDALQTTERTYVEQARQTILGGARETLLFCYGVLLENFGPADVEALRREIPELFAVAREVRQRRPAGIAAYKPPNSHPDEEQYVYDHAGMVGLPLLPVHEFPADAPAAFFPIHALKDPGLPEKLGRFIGAGRPVLLTDGLARRLSGKIALDAANVQVLKAGGRPASVLELPQEQLDSLRGPLLEALGLSFRAPAEVAVYPFADGSWVIENFRERMVRVELNGQPYDVGPRSWLWRWKEQ
jgi:hypothetical protein